MCMCALPFHIDCMPLDNKGFFLVSFLHSSGIIKLNKGLHKRIEWARFKKWDSLSRYCFDLMNEAELMS